jgi:hypothetical protein
MSLETSPFPIDQTPSSSSSSSSSSGGGPRAKHIDTLPVGLPQFALPTRKKTFERSSLYTDNTINTLPPITDIRNWANFQEYQDLTNKRLNEADLRD